MTTVYSHPAERVLFYPDRDANPFFHFFEALWMLAGREDLEGLTEYLPRFKNYSDDGKTLYGAYGYRLREHHRFDQLATIIDKLRTDRYDRRTHAQIWEAEDLVSNSKDVPCNTGVDFWVSLGKSNERNRLNMMTTSRSHDIIWGAYGANAVHFSYIQEYVARALDLEMGTYEQVSVNYHAYRPVMEKTCVGDLTLGSAPIPDPYSLGEVAPYPLMEGTEVSWDEDLALFVSDPRDKHIEDPFFLNVAIPMYWAHKAYKRNAYDNAIEILAGCKATDWKRACIEWLTRRKAAWVAKVAARVPANKDGMEHPFGYDPEEDMRLENG